MTDFEDAFDDYMSGLGDAQWEKIEDEVCRCKFCGHVGQPEGKFEDELQGDGVMTGYVSMFTGDVRCTECGSEDLEDVETPDHDDKGN